MTRPDKKAPGWVSTTHMQIKWKTVALVLGVISLGLLVSLFIVVTKRQSDVLATTALGLAVVAFAAQLIVHVAQVEDSSSMRSQAGEINAATSAALATIGKTVGNSEHLIREQNRVLLNRLLDNTDPMGDGEGPRRLYEGDEGYGKSELGREDDQEPISLAFEVLNELTSNPPWPNEEDAVRLFGILNGLSPVALGQLVRMDKSEKVGRVMGRGYAFTYAGKDRAPFTYTLLMARER